MFILSRLGFIEGMVWPRGGTTLGQAGGGCLVGLLLLVVDGRVCVCCGILLERCIERLSFAASFISSGSSFRNMTFCARPHVESVLYTVYCHIYSLLMYVSAPAVGDLPHRKKNFFGSYGRRGHGSGSSRSSGTTCRSSSRCARSTILNPFVVRVNIALV